MQISNECVELVKHFEGYFANEYICPAGVKTKGYGSTGTELKHDDPSTPDGSWSEPFAAKVLQERLQQHYGNGVSRLLKEVGITPTQNQFDALVSFAYNCGIEALRKSTFLREWIKEYKKPADQRNLVSVAHCLARFNKGNGKVLPGLVRRRKAEIALFLR
jgi:lysozyme